MTEPKYYHDYEPSSHCHHPATSAANVSDVSTAVSVPCDADSDSSDTVDTVADVSTQFHRSDESLAVSKTQSSVESTLLAVEPSSPDDCAGSQHHQHTAAINLLLWKLTELERRITLGQVTQSAATVPYSTQSWSWAVMGKS